MPKNDSQPNYETRLNTLKCKKQIYILTKIDETKIS